MDYKFPKVFSYGYGWRFRLMVFEDNLDEPIFSGFFLAPSLVLGRTIAYNWRKEFKMQNDITDESNFVYDLYNLSLGDRRKVK